MGTPALKNVALQWDAVDFKNAYHFHSKPPALCKSYLLLLLYT